MIRKLLSTEYFSINVCSIWLLFALGMTRHSYLVFVASIRQKRTLWQWYIEGAIWVYRPIILDHCRALGWMRGWQALAAILLPAALASCLFRSASLYHPRRHAILHIRNMHKSKLAQQQFEDKPPYMDLSPLSMRSLQLIMASAGLSSLGTYTPFILLVSASLVIPQASWAYTCDWSSLELLPGTGRHELSFNHPPHGLHGSSLGLWRPHRRPCGGAE